jgi:hypothetical protein
MPEFHCSYLTYYSKITADPTILRDNRNYNGISSFIPWPCKVNDYVTYLGSKFHTKSKIFKVHKIENHEVVLLDFSAKGVEKNALQRQVLQYRNTDGKNDHNGSVDGGSAHMDGPMYKLAGTYGKDIPYFTMGDIAQERNIITNIAKQNFT